jgi:hypothetical protein
LRGVYPTAPNANDVRYWEPRDESHDWRLADPWTPGTGQGARVDAPLARTTAGRRQGVVVTLRAVSAPATTQDPSVDVDDSVAGRPQGVSTPAVDGGGGGGWESPGRRIPTLWGEVGPGTWRRAGAVDVSKNEDDAPGVRP